MSSCRERMESDFDSGVEIRDDTLDPRGFQGECVATVSSTKDHARMRMILRAVAGVALVAGIVAWVFIDRENKKEEIAKRDARWEQERLEDERFNMDFAEVVDLVYKRDAGIYDHLIKANRKLLSVVEGLQESGEKKSEYRKSLEARMLRRLKSEIHDCEMRKERIAFERENGTQKAKRLTFEVFASSCDCRGE